MIAKLIIARPRRFDLPVAFSEPSVIRDAGGEKSSPVSLVLHGSNLAEDINALFDGADAALIDAAWRTWSANTRRAFISDMKAWAHWCWLKGACLTHPNPALVAAWIRSLSGEDEPLMGLRSRATIQRYLVSVGWFYRLAGLTDPTSTDLVKLEYKAARKKLGTWQRQARAIRFKGDVADLASPAKGLSVVALLKACHLDQGRQERALRDEALLRVAVDTGFRRSELVAIEMAHIEGPNENGAGLTFIPKSKTDPAGRGAYGYLSAKTMEAIVAWTSKVEILEGPIFRRVRYQLGKQQSFQGVGARALHPQSVSEIYKRLVRTAGTAGLLGELTTDELRNLVASVSGHSIRVGVAQDNVAAGESLLAIMQAYRWRNMRTVMRYTERISVESSSAARMAGRFEE